MKGSIPCGRGIMFMDGVKELPAKHMEIMYR